MAANVARRLGHTRKVPLGTSRKFWYSDDLSEPMSSITSPDVEKRLYVDPRMLPLLEGRRVVLVDDVASSGRTVGAVLRLLERAGVRPVALAFAMLQGQQWHDEVGDLPVVAALRTPLLRRDGDTWVPEA
ncbi:MAG: phosphoribosyltransferase [Gordonia sp. (in: high G+C Gram-positive bacteria)]